MSPANRMPAARQEDHQVLGRVRRPHRLQHEVHAAEREPGRAVDPAIGRHQARVLVDPGRQFLAAGLQAQPRGVGVQVGLAATVRGDGDAGRLEGLQAVDVVGVVVGDDDVADRLRRDAADGLDEFLRQRRRTERVDHHHPLRRDHEGGVGDEIAVRRRAQRRDALHHPDAGRHLLGLQRLRGRRCGRQTHAAASRPQARSRRPRGAGRPVPGLPAGVSHRSNRTFAWSDIRLRPGQWQARQPRARPDGASTTARPNSPTIPKPGDPMNRLTLAAAAALALTSPLTMAQDAHLARNLAATCANCHGTNGAARGDMKVLAGRQGRDADRADERLQAAATSPRRSCTRSPRATPTSRSS